MSDMARALIRACSGFDLGFALLGLFIGGTQHAYSSYPLFLFSYSSNRVLASLHADRQTLVHGQSQSWSVNWLMVWIDQFKGKLLKDHGHDRDGLDRRKLLAQAKIAMGDEIN